MKVTGAKRTVCRHVWEASGIGLKVDDAGGMTARCSSCGRWVAVVEVVPRKCVLGCGTPLRVSNDTGVCGACTEADRVQEAAARDRARAEGRRPQTKTARAVREAR